MTLTCGIDWAEVHHDVALMDQDGIIVARARIDTGAAGFVELLNVIASNGGTATETPVAIETHKNLLVVALTDAGFTVYPINPRAVARYRDRHGQAGGKSDPGDAAILANILRTDKDAHRTLPATTEHARAVKALARQHQEALWALHQTISRLRSVFLEFYPAALQAFPNQKHKAALTVLSAVPTPTAGRALTRRGLVALLHRSGRRNDSSLVDQILADLHAPALNQPDKSRTLSVTPSPDCSGSLPRCTPLSRAWKRNLPGYSTHIRWLRSSDRLPAWDPAGSAGASRNR